MLEYLLLLAGLLRTLTRAHGDLVAENLLLRQQLAILTRPTRKRAPLRTPDRLFWVLVRLVRGDRRQHWSWSSPRRSCAGTAGGGDSSGAGARGRGSAGRASAPRCAS
jgi:uncharacterized membrane protein YgcG